MYCQAFLQNDQLSIFPLIQGPVFYKFNKIFISVIMRLQIFDSFQGQISQSPRSILITGNKSVMFTFSEAKVLTSFHFFCDAKILTKRISEWQLSSLMIAWSKIESSSYQMLANAEMTDIRRRMILFLHQEKRHTRWHYVMLLCELDKDCLIFLLWILHPWQPPLKYDRIALGSTLLWLWKVSANCALADRTR